MFNTGGWMISLSCYVIAKNSYESFQRGHPGKTPIHSYIKNTVPPENIDY